MKIFDEIAKALSLNNLFDIETERIDLVRNPAIRRRFLLFKNSGVSEAPWEDIKKSDYTIDELARAVPQACLGWGKAQAKKENRDLVKADLDSGLCFKSPDGVININGLGAALQRLPQTHLPENVLAAAKKELTRTLDAAKEKLNKQEEQIMADTFADKLKGFLTGLAKSGEDEKDALKKEANDLLLKMQEVEKTESMEKEISPMIEKLEGDDSISKSELSDIVKGLHEILDTQEEEEEEAAEVETDENETELSRLQKEEAERIMKAAEEKERVAEERIVKAEKAADEAKELVVKMQVEKRQRDWVEKASKEFGHLGVKADELAELLMKFEDATDEEALEKLTSILKANDNVIKDSKFYEELGSEIEDDDSDRGRLEKKAKELQASNDKLTKAEALAAAVKADTSLLDARNDR